MVAWVFGTHSLALPATESLRGRITNVLVGLQLNFTSLKSMVTMSMSRIGRRSGPRV